MNSLLPELAAHLRSRQEEIIGRWMKLCEADQDLDIVGRLTRHDFRDGIPDTIDELCRSLTRGGIEPASDEIQSEAAEHGHHRWKQGFNLSQVIRDWGNLNQVLIGSIEEYFGNNPPRDPAFRIEALTLLARFMTEATSGSIDRFDELRQAEAASLAADLQMMKEQFAALTHARGQLLREAAHDIRGGLSTVATASQVLKLSAQPNDSLAYVLETLDQGVDSVRGMLNSLLDLSRLESGVEKVELLTVDIAEVLKKLLVEHEPATAEKDLSLNFSGPETLSVRTDPEKVRRIAQNLLVNALQHTTSGTVRLSLTVQETRWAMCVADTGPGIQEVVGSALARELDAPGKHAPPSHPRSGGSYRGEGIGLTIVKRLCTLLGAGISLHSEVGRGSTFTVEFPLTYDESDGS